MNTSTWHATFPCNNSSPKENPDYHQRAMDILLMRLMTAPYDELISVVHALNELSNEPPKEDDRRHWKPA